MSDEVTAGVVQMSKGRSGSSGWKWPGDHAWKGHGQPRVGIRYGTKKLGARNMLQRRCIFAGTPCRARLSEMER